MGEETNQIGSADAQKRVVQLRAEIASKRNSIGYELEELRRRRELAIFQSKRMAKTAGFGLAGLWIGSSITRALFERYQNDDAHAIAAHATSSAAHLRQRNSGNAKPALLTTMAVMALRWAVDEYVRHKLMQARERLKDKQNARDNYDEGEYFASAPI